MKRMKKHKKKSDRCGTSRPIHDSRPQDLTYFIHDRVDLLQQAFSVLKPKEILAMAPDSVRNLPIDNLQELCLEELLGISSKRLCAILDGGAPPSDTDSSSNSDRLGVLDKISLESISSDEEALGSETCAKEKRRKRCKRRERESKKRKEKNKESATPGGSPGPQSRAAERAGLTVLELIELQARARAIRAQLQAERKQKEPTATVTGAQRGRTSDDDDVEIKEEPAVVVELSSSDDEKPDIEKLKKLIKKPKSEPGVNRYILNKIDSSKNLEQATFMNELTKLQGNKCNAPARLTKRVLDTKPAQVIQESMQTITKRNDLTVIVPKQTTKKIKLNRQKSIPVLPRVTVAPVSTAEKGVTSEITSKRSNLPVIENNEPKQTENCEKLNAKFVNEDTKGQVKPKKKNKIKKKKRKIQKDIDAERSDQDEISLQLSDSEKMDLFEDFDKRSSNDNTGLSSEDSPDNSSDECDEKKLTVNLDTRKQVTEITNVQKDPEPQNENGEKSQIGEFTSEKPEPSKQTQNNLPEQYNTTAQLGNLNIELTKQSSSDQTFKRNNESAEIVDKNHKENNESIENNIRVNLCANGLLEENCTKVQISNEVIRENIQEKTSTQCDEIGELKGAIRDDSPRKSITNSREKTSICAETQKIN